MSRRRRWAVLPLLTGGRVTAFTKGIALVLGLALLAGVGGGVYGLGYWPNPFDRHHGRAAPGQRWGSAASRQHVVGRSGNRTIPKTLRARYPLRKPVAPSKPKRNRAWVAEPPSPKAVKGFDAKTSREVPAWRGADQRAYLNADGTQTSEFSTTPINYWNSASRSWAPIDSRLVRAGSAGWRNAADAVDIRVAGRADAPQLASVAYDPGHAVGFALQGADAAAGQVDASTVTFTGALPGVDVLLQSHSGGVKETLVLNSADAPHRYVFPLSMWGLRAQVVGGQVVFTDEAGRRRAVIPAGFMWDSAEDGARSAGVTYRLVTVDGRPALETTLDSAWLNDPHRRFPVRVDPSVESDGADSSLVVHGGSSTSGSSELLVGRKDGAAAASYVKFSGLASQLQGHTIFGAQLSMLNFDSASCKARSVSVHPVTQSWSSGSSFSYPGPDVGPSLTSSSFAYGFIGLGQSRSSCPSKVTLLNLGNAGRKLVQGWADGGANNGLSLRASSSDDLGWKRFAGSGTVNPPRLYVTHSPYNAKYSIPNPVPSPPVLQNQSGHVKVTATNLSAETWTPSTYYLAYRAYNADTGASVVQQRAANLPGNVARDAKVTLDATIQPLPPGKYFLDFTMVHTGGPVFTDEQVPPARIVLEVIDIPPVLQELYPPNGYEAPTLSPQLWAQAIDIDAPAGSSLQYKFEVCDQDAAGNRVGCTTSAYQAGPAWTPPPGRLVWSKTYQWRAFVKDATTEVPSPYATLFTHVPQPAVTGNIAGAPFASQDREFDPQVGNFSTAAVDASVAAVGTDLKVMRTYNSLDPRHAPVDGVDPQLDAPFGAGWRTQFDMRLIPDGDGSGNVVVSYPDGQEVRFGKNPDGTYAAPQGRIASLTFDSGTLVWTLKDTSGTSFQFASGGELIKITDVASHSIVLTYNSLDGHLAKAQISNSLTNHAGRALFFAWTGGHITSVHTDLVAGQALTWTYTYSGDLLTQVCAPGAVCTTYEYGQGSHYRSAVLDDRPDSYWRLGESDGVAAGSEVAVNLGKDSGLYHNVTLAAPGVIAGSQDTAASFNGLSSYMELPKGTVKKSRDAAVELWFKTTPSSSGGPLLGYQDKAVGTASTTGVPVLYQGTDGKLHGQFWNGAVAPMASPSITSGTWHHAVISSMGDTQTLYLDGNQVATTTNPITDVSKLTFNQIGAAYATTPASWPGWGTTSQRFYNGTIDDVAIYNHPLSPPQVKAHYQYGTTASDQLTKATLPSGLTAAEASYDDATGRVADYTDRNGGTWKIGAPMTYGGDADLRRGVEVRDPSDRPYLYEYDALTGQMIRSGSPTGLVIKDEDTADYTPTPTPTPTPTQACTTPDPGDPQFCTTIPPESGGPVFTGHNLDGMAIRSFSYDANGFMNGITDENGDTVTMTNDDRGNLTSRKTCRSATECHTEYFTYPATSADPLDPLSYLPTQYRDGRSASATDNQFLTSYTYHFTGQPLTQTRPNLAKTTNTYSNGSEVSLDGGNVPTGLVLTTTDARNAVTRYAYYQNGDLAKITAPSGLVTTFTYDALGRMISKKEVSDTFAAGLTTIYTYDALSRVSSVTEPVTTDAVTEVNHQRKTTYTYDADGNLTSTKVEDLLGGDAARITTDDYDEHGRLERVTDPEGNETSYTHDEFGNTTSMVDANDNRYEYGYTARNQLAEVRLRDFNDGGPSTGDYLVLQSYAYDFAGRLARDIDPMGRRTEYTYYADDLLKTATLKDFHNPDGTTRDIALEFDTYDGAGNLTHQVADNGQTVTDQSFNPSGTLAAVVQDPTGLARRTAYTYDGNDNVTKVSVSGSASNVPWPLPADPQVVSFTYDTANNLTAETQTATGLTSLVTSHTYDQRGLETSTTDPRGNVTGADKAAYTTTFTNDELGRQTTVTGPAVSAESNGGAAQTVSPVARTGYDTFDDPVAGQDPLGNITRTTYDRLGRPATVTAPTYTPPGGSPITPSTTTSYDGLGNITEMIDPAGNSARYTYDRLNRLTERDEPSASNDDRAVSHYTYTRTGQVLSVTDPTGAEVTSTYDDLDRQATLTQLERHPVEGAFTTTYGYDDAGNPTTKTTPTGAVTTNTYNKVGELTQSKDPSGVTTTYGYDFADHQLRATDGLGHTHRSDYDLFGRLADEQVLKPDNTPLATQTYTYDPAGNLTAVKDPLNHTTTYDYDAANQLTRQIEPVSDTDQITTTFGYDAAGNRTRFTDGRGNSTIYSLNTLGLPESTIEPATAAQPNAADRTWTTGYNATGDPVQLTEPGGVTRTRTFDAAGRLKSETGTGAEAATAARTLSYDAAGRLTKVGAPGGDDTYTYNDRGEMLTADGPSGEGGYAYDADGQLTQDTDASGTSNYTYLKARLATVTDGITGTTQTLGYDAAGAPKSIDYGSGRLRSFSYDDFGRLATDQLKNGAGQTVASIGYGYDTADRLTSKTTTGTAGAGDSTYTYDFAGRLASWTAGTTTTTYDWDASGNRIKNGTKTAVFDARNQLQSDGDYTYTYSPRGTLASRTSSGLTEPFSYDAFDRLANANGTTYSYDGLDRIAARGSQQFAYAGLDSDPASDGTATYARDPGGSPIAVSEDQSKQLTLSDQHGDVVGGFNSTDTALTGLTASAAFDPFGQKIAETTGGTAGNLGYQGDWTDPATDQVDMGARWYNPGTGAFDSRDDWTLNPQPSIQANDYTYANADPLNNTDPTGHYCWVCVIPKTGLEGVAEASTAAGLAFASLGVGAVGMYYIWRPSPTVDDDYAFDPYYPGFGVTHGCLCGRGVSPGGGHHRRPRFGSPGLTAAQRAEAALQALLARLRAITAAARHHADWAAKHTRLPAPTAAGKPLFSNKKSVISTNPHLPAKRVGVSRDVVADQNAATQAIYHQALEDAGPVIHDISIAVQVAPEDTSRAEPGSSIVGAPNDPGPRVTTVATPASGDGVFGLPTTEDEEDRCTPYKHNDPLDGIGRAQGGSARYCSESDLEGGSEANDQIFPPGFPEPDENGLSTNPMLGSNRMYDRCHIIGRQLGGDGDDEQNLFTCLHTVNTPTMRRLENQVKRAVKARQQVDYRVTLIYRRRSRVMPSAIHIVAHGTGPGGFPGLSIDKCLENNMQGRVLDGDAC